MGASRGRLRSERERHRAAARQQAAIASVRGRATTGRAQSSTIGRSGAAVVTRPVRHRYGAVTSCGLGCRAPAQAAVPKSTFGAVRYRAFVLDRELRLHVEPEHHRREVGRERAHRGVVVLHRLDVAVARDRDAVLGAFELRLQVAELRVRLEVRIFLGDGSRRESAPVSWSCASMEFLERLPDR